MEQSCTLIVAVLNAWGLKSVHEILKLFYLMKTEIMSIGAV